MLRGGQSLQPPSLSGGEGAEERQEAFPCRVRPLGCVALGSLQTPGRFAGGGLCGGLGDVRRGSLQAWLSVGGSRKRRRAGCAAPAWLSCGTKEAAGGGGTWPLAFVAEAAVWERQSQGQPLGSGCCCLSPAMDLAGGGLCYWAGRDLTGAASPSQS